MKGQKQLFSSVDNNPNAKDDWRTPRPLFEFIERKLMVGPSVEDGFTIDLCASDDNHLVDTYFTEKSNALVQNWDGNVAFINPPFSLNNDLVNKACWEMDKSAEGLYITWLIPARTSNKWFHKLLRYTKEIIFIKGRVKYWNNNNEELNSAPFPSCILLTNSFVPFEGSPIEVSTLEKDKKGNYRINNF